MSRRDDGRRRGRGGALLALALLLAGCGGASGERADPGPSPDAAVDAAPNAAVDAAGADVALSDGRAPAADALPPTKPDGAAADATGPDAGTPGAFLDPCIENADCASGWCIEREDGYVCTRTCEAGCPDDWYCVPVVNTTPDVQFVCKPARRALCEPCTTDAACLDGYCLPMGEGVSFCSGPCSHDGACPAGYVCEETTSALRPTLTSDQCLPQSGVCDCGPGREDARRPCLSANDHGTCWGVARCDPDRGWVDCSAREAAPETCDGVDEDCDGYADEGLTPPSAVCEETNEHGACRGEWLCQGADGWRCTAGTPEAETCNYRDDDCDGLSDEDFRDPATGVYALDAHCGACGNDCVDAWPHAVSVCAVGAGGTPSCVIERCAPGTWRAGEYACVPVDSWLCQPCPSHDGCPVPGDACLSLDGARICGQDCSADSVHGAGCPEGADCVPQDDGGAQCVPATGSCACWLPDHEGATRGCVRGNEHGVCVGLETCGAGSGWSACSAPVPAPEACNGRDDDCDGAIDEALTPPAEPCARANEHGRCVGEWSCSEAGGVVQWLCDAPSPRPETCDFVDEDCDGETDEDFRAATPAGPGAYDAFDHCGVCGYSCAAAIPFADEVACEVDEGLARCVARSCESGYDVTPDGAICVPFVGTDDCAPCEADVQCEGLPGTCEPLDGGRFCLRACDPETATERTCPLGFACAATGAGHRCVPSTGSCTCYRPDHDGVARACARENDAGVCTGLEVCDPGGGWSPCSAAEPAPEACNGRDDDCDGFVDVGVRPPDEPCAHENEHGRCEGAWRCAAEGGVTAWRCDAAVPAAETCDYADDDCDGATDEDFRADEDGDGIGEGGYDGVDHCGVCGYSCDRAIPFSAETACVVTDGDAACGLVACEPGYGQPPGFDICVPFGAVNDCSPCASDDHCAGLPGACVLLDAGTWCVRDCATDADCGGVFDCVDGHCLPKSGSCTCSPEQAGATRPCYVANVSGVCTGEERCDGIDGWSACSAATPAPEACGGGDEDCDGQTDEPGALGCAVHARDDDRDGWGVALDTRCLCAPAVPYDAPAPDRVGDCDDGDPAVHPAVPERCDGLDDDCDGHTDEAGADGCTDYARDADGDGFGETAGGAGETRCLCAPAFPWTATAGGDCDDGDPAVAPEVPEACNGTDDDCDGETDEPGAIGCVLRYADGDADGHGDAASGLCTCAPDLARPIAVGGDCDDEDPGVHPDAEERCDPPAAPVDDDCDGLTDEPGAVGCAPRWRDDDGDGYGALWSDRCLCADEGAWTAAVGGDCDDDDPLWRPGVAESCTVDGDCCRPTDACRYGVCVPAPTPCDDADGCPNDAWCDDGECVPYGVGPGGDNDPTCARPTVPELVRPAIQCAWNGPPAGDPYPGHRNVLSTAMVADFDFDDDPTTVRPSIVFTSYNYTDGGDPAADGRGASAAYYGVVRVIDGATCAQQYNVDARRVVGADPLALGDIDRDGRPDILANGVGGGLVAFGWDAASDTWSLLWESHTVAGAVHRPYANVNRWFGPSLSDIDGDGSPEAVMGAYVYDRHGALQAGNLGTKMYSRGRLSVLVDVDLDGAVELVTGDGVWSYETDAGGGHRWLREPYNGASADGFVAVGDFGDFPVAGLPDTIPEVVVISSGYARVMDLAGETIFGPYPLPYFPPATNRGTGGQPTVGDFDGDGRPEFALAGRGAYTIFDFDCALPLEDRPTSCQEDGILWSLPSQDYSSSMTGSSIFDFDGDGFAEAVYSDECFTRVYRGLDGEVLFSQWRTSCTWYENPVIADVDGDGYTEIVMGSNTNCNRGRTCHSPDPYFRGLRCEQAGHCTSGVCVAGFCRCQADDDCGGDDFVCTDPLPNTPGAGRVCRASHPRTNYGGLRVYQDTLDNWVNSRTIWNQHPYFVTNVHDDGTIPTGGAWATSWLEPGLNSFRQNVQGRREPTLVPDLTVRPVLPPGNCDADGVLTLEADICNRGAALPGEPIEVAVYEGDPASGRYVALPTTLAAPAPGTCERIAVTWAPPAPAQPRDIVWTADYTDAVRECWEENNGAVMPDVSCVNLP